MKTQLITTALYAALTVAALAGTDAKDMKEIAAPAPTPSDAGFYVALYGGADLTHDTVNAGHQSFNDPGGTSLNTSNNIRDVVGPLVGGKFGYKFDSYSISDDGTWRLQPAVEAEIIYIDPDISNAAGFQYTPAQQPDPPITLNTHINYTSLAGFVNGIVRIKTGTLFTPYVGIGVGGQHFDSSMNLATSGIPGGDFSVTNVHASDTVFAAQGLVGFDCEVAKGWEIFTEYKYIAAFDPNFVYTFNDPTFGPSSYSFNPNYIGQHIVTAGVRYSF